MERVTASLENRIMTAEQAAQLIKTGMTIGVSGFTSVGYPKAVPLALAASGHAKDLTLLAGASIGDEIDGALVRAGLIKNRFAYQSKKDMRNAINKGDVQYADYHISHFPMNIDQGVNAARVKQLFSKRCGAGIALAVRNAIRTALDGTTASTATCRSSGRR